MQKGRAALLTFLSSLISYVFPVNTEPWLECQLELILDVQPTKDLSWNELCLLQPTNKSNSPSN